ncbi:MAG: Gfo/Idh/MocA family oxidoreductase [Thermoguttaceae bacterium]|jgi:predicted dehydrogenase
MQKSICRWGILGTAEIARKNWQAIRNAPNCSLTAVASRDLEKCRRFIRECQRHAPFDPPPRACGSYDELLAGNDVDAIYIPLPTGIRKPWVIRAAELGKHVLVEKPVGATSQDVREILAACRHNGVQFMDGVMFMHSRRLDNIRNILNDGQSIGPLKRITSQFSFGAGNDFFASNIRTNCLLEPLGCLGDLGWYNIRLTLWTMNWALPGKVTSRILAEHRRPDSPAAVPTEFSAELFYADGVSAGFYCSYLTEIQQWVILGGAKGSLYVPDFVLPWYGAEVAFEVSNPIYNVTGCDFNMEEHARRFTVSEYSNSTDNSQETNMFRKFAELALSGQLEHRWGEMALKTQQVLDACLQSAHSGGCTVDLSASK